MLVVYLPYGAVVTGTLLVFPALTWRLRFLATALLLGPLTLARPAVAAGGAAAAVLAVPHRSVAVVAGLAVAGAVAVEPACGRLWYSRPARARRRAHPERARPAVVTPAQPALPLSDLCQ